MKRIMLKQLKIASALLVVLTSFVQLRAQTQKGADFYGGATRDELGNSVSMPDAHTLAIGVRKDDGSGFDAGTVRIYRWIDTAWVQKGGDIDGEARGDQSGFSVSMPDSNTVAIGAFFNDGNDGTVNNSGHVRIYSWNGSAWVQKGGDIDGEAANDLSGYSVSMPDSNTVAIGAISNSLGAGHVRIYTWSRSSWVQKGGDIDGEASQDLSGRSVSMPDANTVAIGAPSNDGAGSNSGHVRIYRWNGSAWVQKGGDIDGEAGDDQFGTSVSMPDINTVAIGAPKNDGAGFDAGHVRIYSWNGSSWTQKGGDIDGEAAYDQSGASVSMPDANTVAIGALANTGTVNNAGHVRIYRWNGSAWVQKGGDIDGNTRDDQFGFSVSMPDAYTVAIGAPFNSKTYTRAGLVKVYAFKICENTADTINISACNSYVSPSKKYTYIKSNTYYDTIPNANGCDSIITINLTINSQTSDTINISACYSYESPSKKYTYTNSGTYYDTIPNANGCDSVITINLTINSVDVSVTNSSPTLTANATEASYQWLDCDDNYSEINNANSQVFLATNNGNYAVEVVQNGCTDTSECINVSNAQILENTFGAHLKAFPNPTNDRVNIDLGKHYDEVLVILRNALGQEVMRNSYNKTNAFKLDLPAATGLYILELHAEEHKALIRVLKN